MRLLGPVIIVIVIVGVIHLLIRFTTAVAVALTLAGLIIRIAVIIGIIPTLLVTSSSITSASRRFPEPHPPRLVPAPDFMILYPGKLVELPLPQPNTGYLPANICRHPIGTEDHDNEPFQE